MAAPPRIPAPQGRASLARARKSRYPEAASQLEVAPASLHRAVADLSVALGERLVERRGRHLALTRKGEARARCFGLAMAELRSGLTEVSEWLGKAGGRIVIGAMPLSRARWLPQAIIAFRHRRPDTQLAVNAGSHPDRKSVVSGKSGSVRVDLCVGGFIIKKKTSKQ